MTRTTRKSFAKKLIVILTAALMAFVLALQLSAAPAFVSLSVLPASAATSNGIDVAYSEAPTGLDPSVVSRSNGAIEETAQNEAAPKPDAEVNVIITLGGTPMMEYAADRNLSVAEALATADGINNLNKLNSMREAAMESLSKYIIRSRLSYTTVTNGFSATVRYCDIPAIERNKYVSSVIISNTYAAPQTVTENYVDVYESGIFNSSNIDFDGTGTVVAVLDTGTDYTHEVFDMELDAQTIAITKDDVAAVAPTLIATAKSAEAGDSIDEDDLYLNTKLPFVYDYADSDTNVYPHNSHGTHVAGIIAGKSDVITGVAPGAQIATFKVFSDYKDGAETEWILAALNDAVALNVDAINMSLGTSCGFAREVDEEGINTIYDAINDAGICLVVAASNDYSSAQGSTWGNTNLASNPDSGTVGSPASYDASLAVASISGVKTRYFTVDGKEIYFAESRLVGAKDPNDFVAGMLGDKHDGEFEYVVIPGIGMSSNYSQVDVAGKIAVVRRGTTNFEEKVRIAADKGAVGVIVYNNVSGTISMSVGTKLLIPSCFITMDLAEDMVAKGSGIVKLSKDFLAGPFMSDFSSWGALPNLTLAPDITAHGGEIYSAVAGGDMYDKYSGTSMASPNLAGALILVRQFVKEAHPEYTTEQIRDESYSRMMSTATIVRNEDGNPYSPRKQGAGLANLAGSIETSAYLTVNGSNKPKLSLGHDPQKTGKYTLEFNIVNTSDMAVSYNLGAYVMTESMSSDDRTVSEKAHLFDDTENKYYVTATSGVAKINGNTVAVSGHGVAAVKMEIQLSAADKAYLDELFRNGMFVEGYVSLENNAKNGIDLSLPYLAFYGDWTAAPMLDVSEYQVGASAADDSVLAEDKLKADQYGTLPYSGFASSTATDGIAYWGMGKFAYMMPAGYPDEIPAQEKYAALTVNPDGDYMFYMVSAGLFRGAKHVDWEIRNSVTGELIKEGTDYNARKAHSNGGSQIGGMVDIQLDISKLNLPNNSKYTYTMKCYLDWQDENGKYSYGNNNEFSFEFTVDNEKPEMSGASVRKVKSGNTYRYYLDLKVYDNHYLQGYSISTYKTIRHDEATGNDYFEDGYASITGGVIPVDGNFNSDTTLTYDITSYWTMIQENGGNLYVSCMDYAKNNNAFTVTIKEESDLRIAKTRSARDSYDIRPNQQIDLAALISVTANIIDGVDEADKVYLENYWASDLIWQSTDPDVVEVSKDGLITGLKAGTASVTVHTPNVNSYVESDTDHCLKFDITVAGEATEIALAGLKLSAEALILERGEEAVISIEDVIPYNYPNADSLKFTWTSSSLSVHLEPAADGRSVTVKALDSGSATIRASVVDNPRIIGTCSVRVQQEYLMTNNIYLRSYTGRGDADGVVEIPADMGIVYIYPQAFAANRYIKKVIIPEGVTSIMRAAFASCENLEEVVLPSSVETLELGAFSGCKNLKKINLGKVKTIGSQVFWNSGVEEVDLSSCTYIDSFAFIYCRNLKTVDLSRVGIVGGGAFAHCLGLEKVVIPENTSMDNENYLDGGVFSSCLNLKEVVIKSNSVGNRAFAGCTSLEKVTFENDVNVIGDEAFARCTSLSEVNFKGRVYKIGYRAFYTCALSEVYLPAGLSMIGEQAFAFNGTGIEFDENYSIVFDNFEATLTDVTISSGALLTGIDRGVFLYAPISGFTVEDGNKYLSSQDGVVFDKAKKRLVAFPIAKIGNGGTYTVPSTVKTIGKSAFSYASMFNLPNVIRTVSLNNVEVIEDHAFDYAFITTLENYTHVKYIGDYAFAYAQITNLPVSTDTTHIGNFAFFSCEGLSGKMLTFGSGLNIKDVGDYAFAYTPLAALVWSFDPEYLGTGVFAGSESLESVTFGDIKKIGENMFGTYSYFERDTESDRGYKIVTVACSSLTSVNIPATVESIGMGAFQGSALTKVEFANGSKLTEIPRYAFADTKLTALSLPETVTVIGEHAFAVEEYSASILGCALNLGNVTAIGSNAFKNTAVISVAASKLVNIGDGAFTGCIELASVNAPAVVEIGDEAFSGCEALGVVSINKAETIGDRAFEGTAVSEMVLDNVVSIGDGAFKNADKLATVTLSKVKTIGKEVFSGTAITQIALPGTISAISDGAFTGANSLASITIADGSPYFSKDGVLYLRNASGYYILVGYPAGKTDTKYDVLDRTIKLGAYSFSGNKHLTELTLPVYMQVIGASAMSGMENLSKLTIYAAAAPTLESTGVYNEWKVTTTRQPTDEYGDTDEDAEPIKYEVDRAEYVNTYDNFGFTYKDATDPEKTHDLSIYIPANNSGYDNRIWQKYVGKHLQSTDKIQATIGTLSLIERINNLPADATAAEINTLIRLYNILNAAQRSIVDGDYSYSSDGQSIDKEYYTALPGFGGVNFRQKLTDAQNKLPAASASLAQYDASAVYIGESDSGSSTAAALAVLCACLMLGAIVVSVVLISKRRAR